MGYNAANEDGDAIVLTSCCIPQYCNDVEQEE
jgi:hypothetical protein